MDRRSSLEAAAKSGNIDLLYELINEDPYVLDKIDDVPFVNTPLHVAAVSGKTEFAMEILNLKPSFARKLNADGLSPLHLAVDHGHFWLVLEIVKTDPSLVRLKGRYGMTPFLAAVSLQKTDLISEFFLVCPESIVDANVNGENALHIAVNNYDEILLKALMGWVLRLCQKDAAWIETRFTNQRDKDGNTPLHLAAEKNDTVAVKWMLQSSLINANIENKNGLTVLDIAESRNDRKIGRMVRKHGGKRSASLDEIKTPSELLASELSDTERYQTTNIRFFSWISEEKKTALLVVATLILTATYQTVLSPPGGVSNGGDQNGERTSGDQKDGSVVMVQSYYTSIWLCNTVGFLSAMEMMLHMLALGRDSTLLYYLLFFPLFCAYILAGDVIKPNKRAYYIGLMGAFAFRIITGFFVLFWNSVQSKRPKVRGPKSGLVWEGFATVDQAKGGAPNRYGLNFLLPLIVVFYPELFF